MLLHVLAQSAKTKATQGEIILWVGILAATALLGGLLIVWVRKRILSKSTDAHSTSLMESLRDMLAQGTITQAEFDATRRNMIKKISSKPTPPAAGTPSQPRAEQRPQPKPQSMPPAPRPPAPMDPDQST